MLRGVIAFFVVVIFITLLSLAPESNVLGVIVTFVIVVILISLLTPYIMRLFGIRSRANHFKVNGKTVLLTGGSDGMGKSVAKMPAQKGANIIIVARNSEKLKTALGEIQASASRPESQRFHSISADISKQGEATRIISEASEWNGGTLDIVWCLAGVSHPTLFLDSRPDQHRQMMDVNYFPCVDMAHAVLSQWLSPKSTTNQQQPRHLIFTSSVVAFFSIAGYGPYSPSKAAIRSLSDTLVQEIKLYNSSVKIHTVFPGTIVTAGYEEGNKTKPEITKLLESDDPKESPDVVAKKSIEGLENGEYLITTSFLGSAMRACSWGGSPRNNWIVDSLFMWILNFVWFFIQKDLDGKVVKYGKKHGHGPPQYLSNGYLSYY